MLVQYGDFSHTFFYYIVFLRCFSLSRDRSLA